MRIIETVLWHTNDTCKIERKRSGLRRHVIQHPHHAHRQSRHNFRRDKSILDEYHILYLMEDRLQRGLCLSGREVNQVTP